MAERIYKDKQPSRRENDDGMYHDSDQSSYDPSRARQASQNAGNTIDDIDNLLNQETAPSTPAASPAGGGAASPTSLGRSEALAGGLAGGAAGGELAAKWATNLKGGAQAAVQKKILGMNRKQAGIGGGITGLIISAMTFFGVIGAGDGMMAQYSHLIQNFFQPHSNIADARVSSLLRYARTGNYGETRVGFLGSRVYAYSQAQLAKNGIGIKTDGVKGQASKILYDSKLNSELQGMSNADAKQYLSDKYPGRTVSQYADGKFAVDVNGLSVSDRIAYTKTLYRSLGRGRLSTAIQLRTARAYLGLPSWFKPFSRLGAEANARGYSVSGYLKDYAKTRASKLTAKTAAAKSAAADLADKMGISKGNVAKGLLIQGAICIAKDIASGIDAANRLNVLVPAMGSAGDAMSLGDQGQTNVDMNADEQQAVAQSFTAPDGTTPWDSDLIVGLQGKQGGVPTDKNLSQSFSESTGSAAFEQALDAVGANTICSTAGQIVGGVIGLVLLVGSGGASTVVQGLVDSALISAVLGVASSIATNLLSDDALNLVLHQGAKGGSVDALGGQELANTQSRAQGGVALTSDQATQLVAYTAQQDHQQFMSESFFARTFSIYDYRSLTARLMQMGSFSPLGTIGRLFSSFFGIGQSTLNLAKSFMPKAYAASNQSAFQLPNRTMYDFTMAQASDPAYENPYDNADKAAAIFDGSNAGHYIDKAMTCFGNTISKVDGKWQALPTADVIPASAAYKEGNCGDTSDPNWIVVRFFVLDSAMSEPMACYELNDQQACQNSGMGPSTTTASTATVGNIGTNLPTGTTQQLAQQILSNPNLSFQTSTDKSYFQQIANTGHATDCGAPQISTKLLGVILVLSTQYKMVLGVFDDGHGCDSGFHPKGEAVDLNGVSSLDGSQSTGNHITYAANELPILKAFYQSAADVLKANGGGGLGQSQCFSGPAPAATDPSAHFYVFNDTCNHLHMDVGVR